MAKEVLENGKGPDEGPTVGMQLSRGNIDLS